MGGGAIGAGTGALVEAMAGEFGWGTATGAAVVLAAGSIYDPHEKSKESAHNEGYKADQDRSKKSQ